MMAHLIPPVSSTEGTQCHSGEQSAIALLPTVLHSFWSVELTIGENF